MLRGVPARLGAFLVTPFLLIALATGSLSAAPVPIEGLSIDPAWAPVNTPPASAVRVIRGIGFTPSTTVTFDGVAAAVTFVDSRTLQVQAPTFAASRVATVVVANGADSDQIFPFLYTDAVCYVKPAGNDSGNCLTPAAAKKTIANAISTVQASNFPGTMVEIRLAGGVYPESGLDVTTSIVISGGWDPNMTFRSPDQFVTVIDAGLATFAMRSGGLDSRQVIDGVTVRNGFREGLGGGGFVVSGDNTVISNSVFVGNTSTARGGGIYATFSSAYGGRPVLSKNVVLGNRSGSANTGAGISIYPFYTQGRPIDVSISDNYIVGNRDFSNRGGGLGLASSTNYSYNVLKMAVAGNVFAGNRALSGGGMSVMALGGADHFNVLLDNNLFFGNTVPGEGGGLYVGGTGHITGRFSGNTFAANTAGSDGGGGVKFSPNPVYEPTLEVSNLIAWGNTNGDISGDPLATFSDVGGGSAGTGNIALNPRFSSGPMGRFYLQQDPNGTSPAVDAGSGAAPDYAQDDLTTSALLAPDVNVVDMGFHYPVGVGPSPDPVAVTRVDPAAGDFGGTEWVLVRGQGFDPGAGVTFDGVPATDLMYLSPTRLLAQPAPHAMGAVNVTVTNPDATAATLAAGYRYADDLPPDWSTTVGLQQILTKQDCVRSATLLWNPAVDAATPPVRYSIYREVCSPTSNDFKNPCTNTGYFPGATNFVTTTTENFYTDTAFGNGGADPKYIYMIRAADSASPVPNKEFNYSKRIAVIGKLTTDTTPPSPVGDTLDVSASGFMDWAGAPGAVSYKVYRQSTGSAYATPATLTPLITLTTANNDADLNGVTDSSYTDATLPAPDSIFFYKISALDACNVETVAELGP